MEAQVIGETVSPFFRATKRRNIGDSNLEETLSCVSCNKEVQILQSINFANSMEENKPQVGFHKFVTYAY